MFARSTPLEVPERPPYRRVTCGPHTFTIFHPDPATATELVSWSTDLIMGVPGALAAVTQLQAELQAEGCTPERMEQIAGQIRVIGHKVNVQAQGWAGYLIAEVWSDPVWGFDATAKYLAGDYRLSEEPRLDYGCDIVKEMVRNGIGWGEVNRMAIAIRQMLSEAVPDMGEVARIVGFGAPPADV